MSIKMVLFGACLSVVAYQNAVPDWIFEDFESLGAPRQMQAVKMAMTWLIDDAHIFLTKWDSAPANTEVNRQARANEKQTLQDDGMVIEQHVKLVQGMQHDADFTAIHEKFAKMLTTIEQQ